MAGKRILACSLAVLTLAFSAGCGDDETNPKPCGDACGEPEPQAAPMDFTGKSGFFGAPFPSDTRLGDTGGVLMDGFPNPQKIDLVDRVLSIVSDGATGFGTTSAVYFQMPSALRKADLPDVHESTQEASRIVLLSADKGSPDYLERYPIVASFLADGGPFGAPNLLALLPLQGVPLRPSTRYAAAVLKGLSDAAGKEIAASSAMTSLAERTRPEGMSEKAFASYTAGLDALDDAGIVAEEVVALSVFTTGSPLDGFREVLDAMTKAPLPKPTKAWKRNEVFDTYCVYETTIAIPDFQKGKPPYEKDGGAWEFDADGKPVLQRNSEANFVVTVPRQKMPAKGFPIVVFSRTGGGGERPLVDRGVHETPGGPALEPGTGPAFHFAAAGFAGSSIDGPLGGLRNVTHGDEQFLIFNVANPLALRDNVRQSAAELALEAHILAETTIDVSDCDGVTAPGNEVRFDGDTMAVMGHSMGATISPLSLAFEPRLKAGLLSGAGGSWIENVIYKQKPIATLPIAEALLGIGGAYSLNEWDPALNVFQWAGEPADPPVYAARIVREPEGGAPKHVLMMQGIIDSYILPPIANATSLSVGLDLAGEELDGKTPGLDQFTPLGDLLGLVGRRALKVPVSNNVASGKAHVTAVVTQNPEDGIENGHEVVFQTNGPKRQYRCFLEGLKEGAPLVPTSGKLDDPCQ